MSGSDKITIRFGGYTHPVGTTAYSIQRQAIFDGRKVPAMEQAVVSINGLLHGDGPLDLESKFQELTAAYFQTGVDFSVDINGGASSFSIRDIDALGGIRVTQPPSIPDTKGGAHHKYLPFTVELQATIPYVGSGVLLLSFRESIAWSGGGWRTAMTEALYGLPVKQQTRSHTIYRATQSGQATALFGMPFIPTPIWPNDWTGEYNAGREGPSDVYTTVGTGKSASWSYQFESANPLNGFPNEWGTIL